jgi:superfamily II DNA/RNA helicase
LSFRYPRFCYPSFSYSNTFRLGNCNQIKEYHDTIPKQGLNANLNILENDQNMYLFGENKSNSFDLLSMSQNLKDAVIESGKFCPTLIQQLSYDKIYQGNDIVIGAETGSGKTLAYLIPLIQKVLDRKHIRISDSETEELYPTVVVLVPNRELCEQVQKMSSEILRALNRGKSGREIVTSGCMLKADGTWPYASSLSASSNKNSHENIASRSTVIEQYAPDILICTPAVLSSYVRGPHILNEGLFHSIKAMVIDEVR